MNIIVFLEIKDNKVRRASLEALAEGRKLADKTDGQVIGIILGTDANTIAQDPHLALADKIYAGGDPLFGTYSSELYSAQLASIIEKESAGFVLLASTIAGKDFAPRLAAKLKSSLFSDCIGLSLDDSKRLIGIRPVYSGKLLAEVISKDSAAQMALLRPNIFPVVENPAPKQYAIEDTAPVSTADKIRSRLKEIKKAEKESLDVAEAQVIVAGGRGMKAAENFSMLEELATVLQAAVGASRAAVDSGWIDHAYQVGQTGKVVSPVLYFAVGISGAIQHMAGLTSAKWIVAINKDPEAPIFKVANYGIVGDLFEIVPLLTEEVKQIKAKG